ncbi:hypothetical protein Tco_1270646 [Tanacetum coccineum]
MLHDMIMNKFKLEAIYPLNLSAKLPSFDDIFDITDDNEVRFFVECACNSKDELAHIDYQNNDSRHNNESHFEKPESSFAFGDYNEYEDKQNAFENVVHENPQPNYHKWEKFMSFKPDIPKTILYKSKPMISKEYKKTEVKVGNIFNNQEGQTQKGETDPCWSWWMSVLKECIGDSPNLQFIFDRHAAIALVVHNEFLLAFHDYRKLPVLKLAETYRAMVQEWYFKRRELADNMTSEITEWVANKVNKKRTKSATWLVYGVNHYQYQVSDGRYNHEVDFQIRTSQCRKWQLSGIPYGHVIAVTRYLGMTDCVQFVADWFKKETYQGTYVESIHFLGNIQEWDFPHHIHLW